MAILRRTISDIRNSDQSYTAASDDLMLVSHKSGENWYSKAVTYQEMRDNLYRSIFEDTKSAIYSTLYPVGALYVGTQSICPLANIIGKWELVGKDMVLQGADVASNAGKTISQSLPSPKLIGTTTVSGTGSVSGTTTSNGSHKHSVTYQVSDCGCSSANGIRNSHASSSKGSVATSTVGSHSHDFSATINFKNATGSTSITVDKNDPVYGKSNKVQPPAYTVNIWRRIA